MTDYIVVFITTSSEDEAAKIARALVQERLAACVNIVKGVRSIYSWRGKIEDSTETLMVVKTKKALFKRLEKRVTGLHSYSVPEVISVPITDGSKDYLKWLDEVTGAKRPSA